MFQSLRWALRSGEPLDLLAVVSGFLEVTDPRSRDPLARDEQRLPLAELVESFVGTPYAETTAALRALGTDEVLAARIGRELATRRHPMPDWLAGLDQARVEPDVWFMTHVLGDGDDYLIGVTLPSGHALSALVYVDHNLGTVVKDAFVVPEPLEDLAIKMGTLIEDSDQSLTRTDPATARAVVEAAIDSGSRLFPPLTSDSWPVCRPLVEWMVGMLPTGGVAPEWQEWSEEERAAIADAFFASPYGAPLDREDERDLLGSRAVVRHRLRDRRPVPLEPGVRGDAAGRLVPPQGHRRAGVPGEAAGPAARPHPLLPRPLGDSRRPDRGDPGRGR
ncbi:MAG: hypothetical protein H0U51_02740 [Propionibacteriales bacterium]|nr:hypothetical protein [Propionibacteriales bacterium]